MPAPVDSGTRRSARHSNAVAGPSKPRESPGAPDGVSSQPQARKKRKATDALQQSSSKATATCHSDHRRNPFDVHIRHSKDSISQWLAFHNTGIAARAGPVPDLDRTIRTDCDFIMQACGFEIDWSPDRPLTLIEGFSFETALVQESPETDGIRALCKIGLLICESEVEKEYPGFTSARYVRQGLWDLLEELDVADEEQVDVIRAEGSGILSGLRGLSLEMEQRGLESSDYGALIERLESRIATRSTLAQTDDSAHPPHSNSEGPPITSSAFMRDLVDKCMDLAHAKYADLERSQQYQAGREVTRVIDGMLKDIMGESVLRAVGDNELADLRRLVQCIEALRAMALAIWFGAPNVIPMYLMKEGCIDRLCSCLLALTWSLSSQDQDLVSTALKDGVEGGMVERVRCLDVRMKNYGVCGFERVVEELDRYIVF